MSKATWIHEDRTSATTRINYECKKPIAWTKRNACIIVFVRMSTITSQVNSFINICCKNRRYLPNSMHRSGSKLKHNVIRINYRYFIYQTICICQSASFVFFLIMHFTFQKFWCITVLTGLRKNLPIIYQ